MLSRKAVSETHRLFFQTIQTRHVDFFISLSFSACSRIRLQLRVHFEILNLMPSIAENNNGLSCRLERATSCKTVSDGMQKSVVCSGGKSSIPRLRATRASSSNLGTEILPSLPCRRFGVLDWILDEPTSLSDP